MNRMEVNLKKKRNILLYLACYGGLFIFFLPVVDYYCSWYINIIPVAFALVLLFSTSKGQDSLVHIVPLILSFALFDWYFIHRNYTFFSSVLDKVIALMPILIAALLNISFIDKSFYRNYLQWGIILAAVTSITTYLGLKIYPMASRELATSTEIRDLYSRMNIGGFDYIYSLVMMIPFVLWMAKHSHGIIRIVNVFSMCCYILVIFQSQYTFALIGVILAFILLLFMKWPRIMALIFICFLLIWLVFGGSLPSVIFRRLSEIIPLDYVSDRLLQVSQILAGKSVHTNTTTERIDLMIQGIQTFLSNPVFGMRSLLFSNGGKLSGHSYIIDILASSGIVGFSIFVWIFHCFYRLTLGQKRNVSIPPIVKMVWIIFALIALVNPVILYLNMTILFVFSICIIKLSPSMEVQQ